MGDGGCLEGGLEVWRGKVAETCAEIRKQRLPLSPHGGTGVKESIDLLAVGKWGTVDTCCTPWLRASVRGQGGCQVLTPF